MLNVKEGNISRVRKDIEFDRREPASRHKKILIVDDDPLVVRFLERASKKFDRDIRLDTASNGHEAELKIDADPPDIIILDIYLPGLRGDELCRKIKSNEATRDISVIVVTGFYDESLRKKLVQSGADVVLAKPLEAARIIDLLREFGGKE